MAPRKRAAKPLPAADARLLKSGWPTGVGLIAEASLSIIEQLAEDPPQGALAVFVCEFADIALDACDIVAQGILGVTYASDLWRCSPSGERWTVADVEELAFRVQRYPRLRHVLVLPDADRLDRRCADRLLVLLEEPLTPLLMLMCVPRRELLPATIRGRAALEVNLEVLSVPERVKSLMLKGVSAAVAAESVALAGVRPSLAGLFAADSGLRALAKDAFNPHLRSKSPLFETQRRLSFLATFASALRTVRADVTATRSLELLRYEDLDAESKLLTRELLLVWVEHRRALLVSLVETCSQDALVDIGVCLESLEVFVSMLRTPIAPSLALSALVAASPSLSISSKSR